MKRLIVSVLLISVLLSACSNPASPEPPVEYVDATVIVKSEDGGRCRVKWTENFLTGELTDDWFVPDGYPWTESFVVQETAYFEVVINATTYESSFDLRIYCNELWYHTTLDEPYGTVSLKVFVK